MGAEGEIDEWYKKISKVYIFFTTKLWKSQICDCAVAQSPDAGLVVTVVHP